MTEEQLVDVRRSLADVDPQDDAFVVIDEHHGQGAVRTAGRVENVGIHVAERA
jgi:hypothetical protein